jgi:hypothetical protein
MATDKIAVCNMAFGELGDKTRRMTSFDTPTHPYEQAAVDFYPQALEEALTKMDWPCARKRVVLTVSVDAPLDETYEYKYTRPTDAVVVRKVTDEYNSVSEFLECTEERTVGETVYNDRWLYSSLENAHCVYTFRLDDPAAYSPGLTRWLVILLAEKIALAVTGQPAIKEAITRRLVAYEEANCKALGGKEGYVADEDGVALYTDLF